MPTTSDQRGARCTDPLPPSLLPAPSSWVVFRSSRHVPRVLSSYPGLACCHPQKPTHPTRWDITGCAHEREHAARISRTYIVMRRPPLLPDRGLTLQDSFLPPGPFNTVYPTTLISSSLCATRAERRAEAMSQRIEASLRLHAPFPKLRPSPFPCPRSLLSLCACDPATHALYCT